MLTRQLKFSNCQITELARILGHAVFFRRYVYLRPGIVHIAAQLCIFGISLVSSSMNQGAEIGSQPIIKMVRMSSPVTKLIMMCRPDTAHSRASLKRGQSSDEPPHRRAITSRMHVHAVLLLLTRKDKSPSYLLQSHATSQFNLSISGHLNILNEQLWNPDCPIVLLSESILTLYNGDSII